MKKILQTPRLLLREIEQSDFVDLSKILQDEETMYAYEGAFSHEQTQSWLDNQLRRYREDGFGLYAVILKDTGQFIGQCGLTLQHFGDDNVVEIGYLFNREYWHKGYAIEAAKACKEYAFGILNIDKVYSIIRDNNYPSQKVAMRNGMGIVGQEVKHYRGVTMPHYVYAIARNAYINVK